MYKSFLHVGIGMILILPLQLVKTEEVPPDLVYNSPGCGTGCTIKQISKTGVDRISIGSITHSAPAIDFKLEIIN